jgi:hypothetical protein
MQNPLRNEIDVSSIDVKLRAALKGVSVKANCSEIKIPSFKSEEVVFTLTPSVPGFL